MLLTVKANLVYKALRDLARLPPPPPTPLLSTLLWTGWTGYLCAGCSLDLDYASRLSRLTPTLGLGPFLTTLPFLP